jgi:hypothetical protein
LRCLLDSIKDTTRNPSEVEVVLVVDEDDRETAQFKYEGVNLKCVLVPPSLIMGELNMSGYRAATGEYVMLLNDDAVLRTPGWDERVLAAFRSFVDGMVLVHVNDLVFRDTLCIFPFVTREFCLVAGGICPEGYLRYRIDDHIQGIFELLGVLGQHRRIFLADVVFEHANIETSDAGGVHYRVDPSVHEFDSWVFDSLLDERRRVALEAMRRIDGGLHSREYSTWKKELERVTDSIAARRPACLSRNNPLAHFLESGAMRGRRPNPLFDTAWYLQQYPGVAESGMNPLEHYLEVGAAKGYKPNPSFDPA